MQFFIYDSTFVRLGKRSESMNQSFKCRSLRFLARSFQVKRELLKSVCHLERLMMKYLALNKYFTPDLTKCQRAEAFKLREERSYRTNELYKSNLKISLGCIVKIPEKVVSLEKCSWATCGWYIML